MTLDPQAAKILELTAASDAPALGEGTVAEGREAFAKLTSMVGIAAPEPRTLQEIQIPGPGGALTVGRDDQRADGTAGTRDLYLL